MSSFGSQIQKRLNEIRKAQGDVKKVIAEAAEAGTFAAIETATKNTPPNTGGLAGTNTRTGHMAQAWAIDSITRPVNGRTELKNNQQYASYVNDGHRMDKHFVPGLIINGSMLERSASGDDGGIMVGTKTSYVKGMYMKEKAIGKYKTTVRSILERKARELLK